MDMKEIYENLSSLDISKHVQERSAGGSAKLSYLPWANAWSLLMGEYPDSTFTVHPERWQDDGTVMVTVSVTIGEHTRSMFLPVMGNRNESIERPTTRQISDATMRCLVKCLSLFGLGASLFKREAEDIPDLDAPYNFLLKHNEVLRENLATVLAIRDCLDVDDYSGAFEAWHELTPEEMQTLWRAPSKGGCFDTIHRAKMKSNEWNDARKAMMNLEEA